MSNYWEKLLDVVDRTREKIFFFSANRTYVVMSLEEYERMVRTSGSASELTEQELLEKINRDIAVWKSRTAEGVEHDVAGSIVPERLDSAELSSDRAQEEEDDEFHIEPVEM